MHWDALIFYAEPRELILNGKALIGAASIDVDINDCVVKVNDIRYVEVSTNELTKLTNMTKLGIKARTAYPTHYLYPITYFLTRMGIPRNMYKVVVADPRTTPLKPYNNEELIRNIAYLHGVRDIVITKGLSRKSHKTLYVIHALLINSGYNADKDLAKKYKGPIPCRVKLA